MNHRLCTLFVAPKTLKDRRYCFVTSCFLVIAQLPGVQAGPAEVLPSFEGVQSGSAAVSISGHTLTVNQSSAAAVLDWSSFNIGTDNSVVFNQPSSTSIALNNIEDANASQILGSLTANGQVYLVNANGFLFGTHASVNINSLVATSLNISDAVLQTGIANQNTGGSLGASFTGTGVVYSRGSHEKISILVEKGATITAADQGRVILSAPEVINNGKITAPDGQVILVAATDSVYLQQANSSDLRGLLVEVKTGGDVQNLGTILTARGNTTMMGFAVNQDGVISASTSVALNGSVRLLAREGAQLVNAGNANSSTGSDFVLEPLTTVRNQPENDGLGTQATVTLGSGSVTSVTLDDSGGTAIAGQAQPQSIVDVEAGLITMQGGSQIIAHGGLVNLSADTAPTLSNITYPATITPTDQSNANPSRILLETGSSIDVSGVQNVVMPMSDNIIDLTLFSYELRNDPVQQNSILYGKNVYVDTRLGTALADVSAAEAARQYTVEYRNANAGTVNLTSAGDVIVQQGANINISGGNLDYMAGVIQATYLYAYGAQYSMADANPNLIYQKVFNSEYYQNGYLQGTNAGSVNIQSRDLVLDGTIAAATIYGEFQRSKTELPEGGSLFIDTAWTGLKQQSVIFQNNPDDTTSNQYASLLDAPLYLSDALFGNGLQNFSVSVSQAVFNGLQLNGLQNFSLITGGSVSLPKNTTLNLPDFAQLNLQAGSIDLSGSIIAPSGSVKLSSNVILNTADNPSGEIQLLAGSNIDVSGLWINDFITSFANTALQPLAINAGSITLLAQGNLLLANGSQLNANGGAQLQTGLKLNDGRGGNISLSTSGNNVATELQLGASLSAYSLSDGGTLSITANSIDITNTQQQQADNAGTLNLTAAFFETGGFSDYQLTANAGNLDIAANTQIELRQNNWQLNSSAYSTLGGSLLPVVSPFVLPEYQRTPVNLTLNLAQNSSINGYVADRSISIGQNAVISTDPGATVSLTSDANISVAGTLDAPGGNISLTLTPLDNPTIGYNPNQAIVLEAHANLNTAGTFVAIPSSDRLTKGNLLAGGTISLTANNGYILTDASSVINVSGVSAAEDISYPNGIALQNVAGEAGTVNLTAADGMILQGQFLAQAGAGQTAAGNGSVALGGSLNLVLNARNTGNQDMTTPLFPTNNLVINLSQAPLTLLSSAQIAGGLIPSSLNGEAYISASQISQAGFDNLKLATLVTPLVNYAPGAGAILFDGPVDLSLALSLELDAPLIGHIWNGPTDDGQVKLNADMITLGSSLNQNALGTLSAPDTAVNSNGAIADLIMTAKNIELRGSTLISGFGKTSLVSKGDISLVGVTDPNNAETQNLVGSLGLTGELDLQARDIYPATMSRFTISDLSANGLIKILPANASAYTPLSAAGQLSLIAPTIDSNGNLIAPFGSITLNASTALNLEPGSQTSVSDSDKIIIPFGETQGNGLYWQYPILSNNNYLSGTPQKSITLNSPTINVMGGAVVDLNGGGDLLAYELVQAPGGSIDYLSPTYQQSYVIIPSLQSSFAPYDYLNYPGSGLSPGESVHLSVAVDGLSAGNYVLLPSYYAFLPGAYLISPEAGTTNMFAGTSSVLADGVSVVAGYLETAGSNVSASLWSGFAVQAGSVAAAYSPYQVSYASQYFAANTSSGSIPSLPQDAGNLSLLAGSALNLAGSVSASFASGGFAGQLDISGNNFQIGLQSGSSGANTVFLNAAQLNHLDVGSILIGGTRSRTSSGSLVSVQAANIEMTASTLTASEIILAATNNITLENGATITASGTVGRADSVLTINEAGGHTGNGALLRVSDAAQAELIRTDATGGSGSLQVDAGAQLISSGSMLLEATASGSLLGNIQMNQGQLTLSGNLITLGGVANPAAGFQLSNADLNQLHVNSLTLDSSSSVDIAGALNLQQANLNLTIDSAGILGVAAEQKAMINVASITLQNSSGATVGASPSGTNQLTLSAGSITLGAGSYALNGFSQVNLQATAGLINSGSSVVSSNGNLNITTPVWTADSGANTTLNLGTNSLSLLADGSPPTTNGLGAELAVNAGQIDDYGNIVMGSGNVSLTATNALNVYTGALLDVSGQAKTLGGQHLYSAGGAITLSSVAGNLNNNATLNVSGAELGGNAGSLTLNAANGLLTLSGHIKGFAYQGASGGNFSLDAKNVAYTSALTSDFSTLNNLLRAGGFNGNLAVHQGQGNIVVAATDQVNAANIALTADNGVVDDYGLLNASAAQAGTIALSANNGVLIGSTAKLYAETANPAYQGGSIVLSSAPVASSGAGVTIAQGAVLNVSGGGANNSVQGGSVDVIADRTIDSNYNAQVNIADGSVKGETSLVVYAMAHYLNQALNNSNFQQWLTEGANYTAPAANTTLANLGGFSMLPGLDIQSNTSLNWNITAPLTGAGLLSVRSVGDLTMNQSLSDGFTVINGQQTLLVEPTWSYNLIAGANLASASLQDIVATGNGNLTIAANTSINTGSGAIYTAAAGNIALTNDTSTIYTAGQPSAQLTDPYASDRTANKTYSYTVQYPDMGGAVTLNAGGNIIGADSTQLVSNWLQRSGNFNPALPVSKTNLTTAWGIDFGKTTPTSNSTLGFRENIGALGGGNVNIHAGGTIQDLSVMLPTTAIYTLANGLQEQGGGNLNVTAGGDIAGGVFYVEKGYADISAVGAITGGSQYTAGPIFALGNAQFNVSSGNGIEVGAVLNPFVVAQAGSTAGYFATYTANSGITLQSLGGDINLNNNISLISNQLQKCSSATCPETASSATSVYNSTNFASQVEPLLALYPGNLTAEALTGTLQINGSFSLYPQANGSFALLAANNVTFASDVVLNQLDVDPALLLSVAEPETTFSSSTDYWQWTTYSYQGAKAHAAQALHVSDTATNIIVSANGSVSGLNDGGAVNSAKAITVSAGQDLNNVSFVIQNLNSVYQDVSSINVGGSILYPAAPNPVTGQFEGSSALGIIVAGPGSLDVWAGGNVDLGISGGITSVGAQFNPNLPGQGASITVLAGQQPAQSSPLLNVYLKTYLSAGYQNALTAQLKNLRAQPASGINQLLASDLDNLLIAIATAQAQQSQALTPNAELKLALPILFGQLDLAAAEENTSQGVAAYQAAYNAINQLFPNQTAGNITLDFSQIQTLEGGDINLLAPGGQLNVGLAASDISTGKTAAELGIVAQAQGNINILTQGDVQVNQSRIFTLEAGNITAWSSNGNIDAGRGAKSSLATQLPTNNPDAEGNINLAYKPTIAGSGIRAQSGYDSPVIGNVTLIAPHGVVNAGEAGIGAGIVTIATPTLIGGPNINAGSTFGVPQSQIIFIAPDSAGGSAAAAANSATQSLTPSNELAALQTANKTTKVSFIETQVIGFGACSVSDVREGKSGCDGR